MPVLLRYFKNHDLRTIGATLGISDDAAQKRVSRAGGIGPHHFHAAALTGTTLSLHK